MIIRKTILAVALGAASIPAAFANSGSTWVGGEIGFESHPVQSSKSRAEVISEFQAFRRNPVTADGGVFVGGELGYVPHQHTFAVENGRRVHADQYASTTPVQSRTMSDVERRATREQYVN